MQLYYKRYNFVFKLISAVVLMCFLGTSLQIENAFAGDCALQRALVSNSVSKNISSPQTAPAVKRQTASPEK